ncbi:MAG: TonB-dependent receptor [Chitinophagaceae bacterium]|nr:TonB-dependent receptor [Chitinophagaceae bacterium]
MSNIYFKQQTQFGNKWHLFYDLQYRHIKYCIDGFRENPALQVNNSSSFFNPKAGISYTHNGWKSYLSYSIANKEPNRDDFEAGNDEQPKPERLHDIEMGIEITKNKHNWSATLYYMNYKDQLVLTGKINDVGAYTRSNIEKSYRAGIELQGGYKFYQWMNVVANFTLSRNKVKNFVEYYDDYDNGGQKRNAFTESDIAFSPDITGSLILNLKPEKNTEVSFTSKNVNRQYLDNTGNKSRSLAPYYTQDLRASYKLSYKSLKEINIILQVNNLFNHKYDPNGYT